MRALCMVLSLALAFPLAAKDTSSPAPTAAPTEVTPEKPNIGIGFDDDASSLIINSSWKENGLQKMETYSFGKDIYLSYVRASKDKEWDRDNNFHSKNWEAFLLPDGYGFLLMEREYDGKHFENLSLRLFEYSPKRNTRYLRPANGSPYWSPEGNLLALVEEESPGRFNAVIYDIHKGAVVTNKRGVNEETLTSLIKDFLRARVCDDETPCEPTAVGDLKKLRKAQFKKSGR